MACGPYLTPHITEAFWRKESKKAKLDTLNTKLSIGSSYSTPAMSFSNTSGNILVSNTTFMGSFPTAISCHGNMSVHGNLTINGNLIVTGGIHINSIDAEKLSDETRILIDKIKALDLGKLLELNLVFKKNLKRYRVVDRAYNLAREMKLYDQLRFELEDIWSHIKLKTDDEKAYNIRDAAWDAVVASAIKSSITEDEFNVLYRPYFLISLSESS